MFESSVGYRLPDGSEYSPDAAAVRLELWQALTPKQRCSFPPLYPDLVIELVSASEAGRQGETPCATRWPPTGPMAAPGMHNQQTGS